MKITLHYVFNMLQILKTSVRRMIKSRTDSRLYRHLVLSNGLKCLIISDPRNHVVGCALSVSVGGHNAPPDL